MDYKHLRHTVAASQRVRYSCRIVGDDVIVPPPRLLVADRRRIVAFPLAAHGVQRQVRIDQVDTVHEVPVDNPLPAGKAEVVPGAAVELAERALLTELVCDAGDLPRGDHVVNIPTEVIHSRPTHVLVVRHRCTDPAHLPEEIVFEHVVAGELEIVLAAPPAVWLAERLDEQLGRRPPEVVTNKLAVLHLLEERDRLVEDVVIPALAELLGEIARPRYRYLRIDMVLCDPEHVRWLIGEDAGNRLIYAEMFAYQLGVWLERHVEERLHRLRIHQVRIRGVIEPRVAQRLDPHAHETNLLTFARRRFLLDPHPRLCAVIFTSLDEDRLHVVRLRIGARRCALKCATAILRLHLRHDSARIPRRPLILVVEVRLEAGLRTDFHRVANPIEPFLAQIRRNQPNSAVHEVSAPATLSHIERLSFELFILQVVIPRPERRGPENIRRISKRVLIHGILGRISGKVFARGEMYRSDAVIYNVRARA